MLVKNTKKIVIKLGSTTVVDSKGKFKKKMGYIFNQRYKKTWIRKRFCYCFFWCNSFRPEIFKNKKKKN